MAFASFFHCDNICTDNTDIISVLVSLNVIKGTPPKPRALLPVHRSPPPWAPQFSCVFWFKPKSGRNGSPAHPWCVPDLFYVKKWHMFDLLRYHFSTNSSWHFETDELFYFATSMARELYFHFPGPPSLHQMSIKISCNFRHLFFLSQNPFFVTILALLGAKGTRFRLFIQKMAPKIDPLWSLFNPVFHPFADRAPQDPQNHAKSHF